MHLFQLNFCNIVSNSNDKAETDLNANFGMFTIDGDKKIRKGLGHYTYFYWHTGHIEVVSINF